MSDGVGIRALRGTLGGAVAAMAMTGMRNVTTGLGLMRRTPPERIVSEAAGLVGRIPEGKRQAATELAHWGYGAGAGAVFAAVPWPVCRRAWAGPVYGMAIWGVFEIAIAPALGLKPGDRAPAERAALAGDHLLYGALVGAATRLRDD